jgi:protein dithiol oxidoreductase (disulfide-forming)
MRIATLLSGLLMLLMTTLATANESYVEGKHYIKLEQPVKTGDPSKIEVAEVFAYSCPHCFHFEPLLQGWEKTLPADVYVVQNHALWNDSMEPLARGYYTSVILKIRDKTHMAVFKALHEQHKKFTSAEDWADFFANFGVDKAKTLSTYNSFGVSTQIKQADARVRSYKVTGTPELVVNGKYRVSSRLTGGQAEMLKVAAFLVAKERASKGR